MAEGADSGVTYTAIESFCGPGGLSLGLRQAGFDVRIAFDANAIAVETYRLNLHHNCFQARAEEVPGTKLLYQAGLEAGNVDLFSGGSPCQGFSKQKRGAHLGDDRNQLVLEYARLVTEIKPRFFMLENVAMLGQKRGKEFINEFSTNLQDYVLYPHFYNSADYGVAQTRERFIVVGKRKDIAVKFHPPCPTVINWKTVGEVLNGIPEPPEDYTVHPDYPNHQRARDRR